jgi:hypothetical protein
MGTSHLVRPPPGDLRQRLRTHGLEHPFDKLAETANGMLDAIEAVEEMAVVGNEIAHDLRTPSRNCSLSQTGRLATLTTP